MILACFAATRLLEVTELTMNSSRVKRKVICSTAEPLSKLGHQQDNRLKHKYTTEWL